MLKLNLIWEPHLSSLVFQPLCIYCWSIKKWIGIICGIGFILLTLLATFQPYRLDRINSWYDPWSRSQEDGYQIVQSILAIGSGGFSGMGLGHGFSKYSYLPESHTDFAFAVFCQEIGFIGAFIVFLLLIALAFLLYKNCSTH
mgnify:CR=1 FL=1